MKKISSLALVACALFIHSNLLAQVDVKLNATSLIGKRPMISAEFGSEKVGVEVGLGYMFKPWADGTTVNGQSVSSPRRGLEAALRGNFYFNPIEGMDGWFASPYVSYRGSTIDFNKPVKSTKLGVGGLLGRKGLIAGKFGYQVEAGLGYNLVNSYKEVATGNAVDISESIPLIGSLFKSMDRIQVPLNVTVFYRIRE